MKKHFISAQQLLNDSYALAEKVFQSGFRPNYIVGVWRGGAPVGIAVQELLQVMGVEADHIAIRTSSYRGIGQRDKQVRVHGLSYLVERLQSHHRLLIVDDVHDSGLSIEQTIRDLQTACKQNTPEIRIGTPYYKPQNNQTGREPHYYLHRTDQWLVFPHEIHGLSREEILTHKPELAPYLDRIATAL
ncbi:phosphoribosyltransferase [Microbulbifer aestuariivivens]|uniref:phosphoribosyltransferase n=1 Tax=Microbulbifer aestuariivivens TaxID=1908308 RepID=UPI0031E8E2D0